jgi:uncharacterized coiled-coil DUF342 family protein
MSDEISQSEFEELKARVRRLETKLEEADENPTATKKTAHVGTVDRFDRRVLESLEPGEVVTLKRFRTLYNAAGVKDGEKIKARLQALTDREEFNSTRGIGRWKYVGE